MASTTATSPQPVGTTGAGTVGVLLPLPLRGPYDYRVPAGMAVAPGDFVSVPLGPRQVAGVVWGAGQGDVPPAKLRSIAAKLPVPPMPRYRREFLGWLANYTVSPVGAALRLAMSVPAALSEPRFRVGYVAAANPPAKLTAQRRRVLEVAAGGSPRSAADLAEAAGVGAGVVRALADAGALVPVRLAAEEGFTRPDPHHTGLALSGAQGQAAAELRAAAGAGDFSVTLLEGVTGSGKTEVYFAAVAEALARGRQALVMVPEIALTAQWLERFHARFGVAPAEWHSELPMARRRATWRAVADGTAPVVVGARSALFLPYADLGLVVVDEEHDGSYKQEEGVIYNARDMAVVLGRLAHIPVVLVSATPSLETVVNVQSGRYRHLQLPDRFGGAELPTISAVDLRTDPPPRGHWLSPTVVKAVGEALAAGSQAMLFLNRRGYAPLTLCRSCGHRMECPNCQAWLVEHRHAGRLECHHCGFHAAIPEKCPNCTAPNSFAACGPGVERVAEEVARLFPEARAAVMASDTIAGPTAAADLVRAVAEHRVDVLIGTQIVAKGHHFPLLTVVAVVDADLGLAGGDLRAAERTYQLLSQVAGRAGRAERPGRVFLQTYAPEHPVMEALLSGDRDAFIAREATERRDHDLPPFGRMVALIASGTDPDRVAQFVRALARAAPAVPDVHVLGPAPAPLAVLRGRHRHRLLVKATRAVNVQDYLRRWLGAVPVPGGVHLAVDVDPYSFL